MKSALFVAVAVMLAACDSQPFAPEDRNLEPLSVVVTGSRSAGDEEKIPDFDVSSSRNTVSVHVTTHAECGTIVKAGLGRRGEEINVVSRIWSDPLADCAAIPARYVADYSFIVPVIPDARYQVNMFEARGSADPTFLGSKGVNVISTNLESR